jgi:glucose/arabinose dehydrogenase
VVRDGRKRRRPFLDLSRQVRITDPRIEFDHRGLLSMAFAPDYRSTGRFYVLYTDRASTLRVDEFRRSGSDPHRADPVTGRTVLAVGRSGRDDFGGHLAFGPDGYLYVGLGFGSRPENAQDLSSLRGKLLRIDPRAAGAAPYSVPPDNPFTGRTDARPEIFAYGLRNPWRFSFDRPTGDLLIGDVGQYAVEEVDLLPRAGAAGANLGWPLFEGRRAAAEGGSSIAHVPPVLEQLHSRGFCALIGGYVVRRRAPSALRGRYVYGDLCSGAVHAVRLSGGRARGDRRLRLHVRLLTSFGEDGRGRLYAVSIRGRVYRFVT